MALVWKLLPGVLSNHDSFEHCNVNLHFFQVLFLTTDTQAQGGSQTLYTAPHNAVVSHGPKIWGLPVFADHPATHTKTNVSIILCAVRHFTILSSCSDRSRCRWHMHLMNHSYFDSGKKLKTPIIWAPCRDMAQVLWSPFICDFWQNYMYRLLLWKLFHLPAGDNVIFFFQMPFCKRYTIMCLMTFWMNEWFCSMLKGLAMIFAGQQNP